MRIELIYGGKMDYLKEGLEKLESMNIPFSVGSHEQRGDRCYVQVPKDSSDKLRGLGFRVGGELFDGEQVVFYKGRFFGLTAG